MATFKELLVYKKAFALALEIRRITKLFPKEEQFALVNQMRRSSRSVCIKLAEGFRKVKYPAHFIAKATDVDMENSETDVWLDFSLEFGYISNGSHVSLASRCAEIGRLLNNMIENPAKYGAKYCKLQIKNCKLIT